MWTENDLLYTVVHYLYCLKEQHFKLNYFQSHHKIKKMVWLAFIFAENKENKWTLSSDPTLVKSMF